ncbi:MAG: GGDEF domain-containing protein [Humidesulfovibrio sp.]|uniref:sensor domain-containing diguanylate cyclase n=1 Tax=Humidesulfovibrio sp. TaxID=2910988 RepID=UPI0027E75E4B|nr:GGDEF domain-containing protein [Humidesulfovibrio sp.]MDQ7836313.1 GGDEF domain-containing protein [Humidesulfovibrio sp.]
MARIYRSYSLVQRLRLILWAMFLVPLLVGLAFFLLYSSQALHQETQRDLKATLALQQQFIEYWVKERAKDVGYLAADPRVLLLPPDSLRDMLTGMLAATPAFDDLVYVGENGRTKADPKHPTGVDVSDREYFLAAKRGQGSISNVITSRTTGAKIIVVASPVMDSRGQFKGLVFGSVRLDTLLGLLQAMYSATTSRTFLLDAKGTLLSPASNPAKPDARPLRSLHGGDVIYDSAKAGTLPSGIYRNRDDERVVGVYRWILDNRWLLVAEKPESEIMRLHAGILGFPLLGAALLFLGFGPVALRLARSLEGPVRRLEEHSRKIEGGDFDVQCDPEPHLGDPVEIKRLNVAYCLMVERVRDTLDALRQASLTDHLTGSANRKLLFQEGPRLIDAALRADMPVSLLMLDLDHFKSVNDTYGHAAGDAVLAAFADLLEHKVRQSDIFARVGGEEFAVLAPNAGSEAVCELAERIRAAVAELPVPVPTSTGETTLSITVSIGAATLSLEPGGEHPHLRNTLESLMAAADDALYQAKKNGRNRVESLALLPAPARG